MKKEVIEALKLFDKEQWSSFIRTLSYGGETDPDTSVFGENFAQVLMELYRSIVKLDRPLLGPFFEACIYNLLAIEKSKSNVRIIYTYLYLIHETRPVEHRMAIYNILRDGELKSLYYGYDNLEQMLINALIPMEDPSAPILHEKINNFKDKKGYMLYLYLYYFAYIGEPDKVLAGIERVINREESLNEDTYQNFYQALKLIFPNYIQLSDLIRYMVNQPIKVTSNPLLSASLNNFITYLDRTASNEIKPLVLFIDDILNRRISNASNHPNLASDLIEHYPRLQEAVHDYYTEAHWVEHMELNSVESVVNTLCYEA